MVDIFALTYTFPDGGFEFLSVWTDEELAIAEAERQLRNDPLPGGVLTVTQVVTDMAGAAQTTLWRRPISVD